METIRSNLMVLKISEHLSLLPLFLFLFFTGQAFCITPEKGNASIRYVTGEMEVASPKAGKPTLVVRYAVPFDGNKPTPTALHVLFQAPYMGDDGYVLERARWGEWVQRQGWSSFSIRNTFDKKNGNLPIDVDSFEEIIAAFKAFKEKFDLKCANFYACGVTHGSNLMHRFAMVYPDYVAGLAIHGSGWFEKPKPEAKNVPLFVSVSFLPEDKDGSAGVVGLVGGRYAAALKFAAQARKLDLNLFFAITPPADQQKGDIGFPIDPNNYCYRLMQSYLLDVSRLHDVHGEKLQAEHFPFAAPLNHPKAIRPSTEVLKDSTSGQYMLFPGEETVKVYRELLTTGIDQVPAVPITNKLHPLLSSQFLIFEISFGVIALFFITVGLRGVLTRRPLLFPSRLMFALTMICFLPGIVFPFERFFDQRSGSFECDGLLTPAMFAVIIAMFWIQMRGYTIYGISAESLRSGLLKALEKLALPFEESFSSIRLPTLEADLQASVQTWMGTAQLRIKPSKHAATLKAIAAALRAEFMITEARANMVVFIFHILIGVFMLITAFHMATLRA